MHYVKQFHINGVDTKQVACIELQSKPNAATEGAVGVLAMDMSSPTHDVYKCVAVNGSIYTWELLSSGMSIISAKTTGEGGEIASFSYDSLLLPQRYFIKIGDLILDSEGYLYQINWLGIDVCSAIYTGTHIGSVGGKTCRLVVTDDGKLQLVTESGAVWSSVDYLQTDENTIYRDSTNGKVKVFGVKTINDTTLKFFVGTQSEYEALTDVQKQDLFAIITDDATREDYDARIGTLITVVDEIINDDKWTVMQAKKDSSGNMINEYVNRITFGSGSIDKVGSIILHRGNGSSTMGKMMYADTDTNDGLGYQDGIISGNQSDVSISNGKITVLHSSESTFAYTTDYAGNAGSLDLSLARTVQVNSGTAILTTPLSMGFYLVTYNDSMTAVFANYNSDISKYITLADGYTLKYYIDGNGKAQMAISSGGSVLTSENGTLKFYFMGNAT